MAFTRVVGAGIHTAANINSHNIKSTGIITATKFDGPFDTLNVTGDVDFSGNVSIGGTLTYEDVTNIDSVGIVTARDGIFIPNNEKLELSGSAGNSKIRLWQHPSLGSMLEFTSQSNGYIGHNASGGGKDLILNSGNDFIFKGLQTNGGVVNIARFYKGGQRCALNADGVEKFTTSSKGIQVGTGVTIETNGQATFSGIVTATSFKLANGSDVGTGAGGTWSTYTAGIATSKSVGVNTSTLDDNDLVGIGNSFQGLYVSNGMVINDNKLTGNHYIGTSFNGMMAGPVTVEGTLTIDGNYVVV